MKKNIVIIGGGNGTIAPLAGLKSYSDLNITAVVNMTDDGGSNRIIRDDFGLLPLSDLRKSILALSAKDKSLMQDIFQYRFAKGDGLRGHTLGNLILMALADIGGSEEEAIVMASEIFEIKGQVKPVTLDDVKLTVEYENGDIVQGEHDIDEPEPAHKNAVIKRIFTHKPATPNPEVIESIRQADVIILGPGDLHTSIIANLVVEGISQEIVNSPAKKIYVTNLMTKAGQTHWMNARELVEEMYKYLSAYPDVVLYNSKPIPADILKRYHDAGEHLLRDNFKENEPYKVVREPLIPDQGVSQHPGDDLIRSLIKHDSVLLGNALYTQILSD